MVSSPLRDRTAVVGIGQTEFGKGLADSELALACRAISDAIDDAGIGPGTILGTIRSWPRRSPTMAQDATVAARAGFCPCEARRRNSGDVRASVAGRASSRPTTASTSCVHVRSIEHGRRTALEER